ncbi:RNA polymerase sigma factor [Planctomicrobium sp. SH668]|uniref:RNA polymerase sigma factor n=1 Tax=Planctomicrobium sp. SH668 TaxID=3448126 RepID=UPI003F5BB303
MKQQIELNQQPEDVSVEEFVDQLYRADSRRVFASLVRLLGSFDLAEEALHDAFANAVESWRRDGIPSSPRAWLVSTGRFKAIDTIRRRARFDASLGTLANKLNQIDSSTDFEEDGRVEDDRLRLIFTCCHPAISFEARVALTLREVCGLQTEEIARAFLTSPSTIAQRIVRGKAKIRDAGIPYVIPARKDLPDRLESVLSVVYLVFNEGYSATSGDVLTRSDLTQEAIRLGALLVELLPETEVFGLLGLMYLQESRRVARTDAAGDLVLLEDQDRSLWDQTLIRNGLNCVSRAMQAESIGSYTIQAAIAAVHAQASIAEQTDWKQIVKLYDALLYAVSSPVVELNRAVATAMADGPEAGLALIDQILERGDLVNYSLAHAAKADLSRRLERYEDAEASYLKSLSLIQQGPERRFLEKRLQEVRGKRGI